MPDGNNSVIARRLDTQSGTPILTTPRAEASIINNLSVFTAVVFRLTREETPIWTLMRRYDGDHLMCLNVPVAPEMPFAELRLRVAEALSHGNAGGMPDPNTPGFIFLPDRHPAAIVDARRWLVRLSPDGIATAAAEQPEVMLRARSFYDAYRRVAKQVTHAPETTIGALNLAEAHHVAPDWHPPHHADLGALADQPHDMAALFSAVLARGPDAPAAV